VNAPDPKGPPPAGSGKIIGGWAALAAVLGIGTAFTVQEEGVVLTAYADPIWGWKVPSLCAGDTEGVKRGDTATLEQCLARIDKRHLITWSKLEKCVSRPVEPLTALSWISLADNVGVSPVCRSTMVRLHNAGHPRERYCLQFTQAVTSYIPFGIPVRLDGNGKLVNTEDLVSEPIGWVRGGFRNCRDKRNKNCTGLPGRREREQAMCLGDVDKALRR
jgi:GH24 family phage-related lysozyme (muramidase)